MQLKIASAIGVGLLIIAATTLIVAESQELGTVTANNRRTEELLIVPGVSMGKVRAGMTIQQVIAEIGVPDRTTGRRLHYVRQGFTVLPRANDDFVHAVFCGDALGGNGPMVEAFKGRTKEGVGMGSSRVAVIGALGQPDEIKHGRQGQEELIYSSLKLSAGLNGGKVVHLRLEF